MVGACVAERPERHVEGALVKLRPRATGKLCVELQRELGLLELALVGLGSGLGLRLGLGVGLGIEPGQGLGLGLGLG